VLAPLHSASWNSDFENKSVAMIRDEIPSWDREETILTLLIAAGDLFMWMVVDWNLLLFMLFGRFEIGLQHG